MLSRKHWRLPKPSAERHTLSPVPVQDKHTMSSCKHFLQLGYQTLIIILQYICMISTPCLPGRKVLYKDSLFFFPCAYLHQNKKKYYHRYRQCLLGSASPQTAYTSYNAHTAYTDQIVCITLLSLLTLLLMLSLNTLLQHSRSI